MGPPHLILKSYIRSNYTQASPLIHTHTNTQSFKSTKLPRGPEQHFIYLIARFRKMFRSCGVQRNWVRLVLGSSGMRQWENHVLLWMCSGKRLVPALLWCLCRNVWRNHRRDVSKKYLRYRNRSVDAWWFKLLLFRGVGTSTLRGKDLWISWWVNIHETIMTCWNGFLDLPVHKVFFVLY